MRKLTIYFAVLLMSLTSATAFAQNESIPVELIKVPEGFKVELLHSVPTDQGSWVSLTHDNKGRLITSDQYGGLFRITPPAIGSEEKPKIEKLDVKMGHAQGLLYAFDSLYCVVNGKPDKATGPGLYRLKDTNNDDQFDEVKLLRKINGGGEHGPHAVILSPDKKSLFVCGGNTPKFLTLKNHWFLEIGKRISCCHECGMQVVMLLERWHLAVGFAKRIRKEKNGNWSVADIETNTILHSILKVISLLMMLIWNGTLAHHGIVQHESVLLRAAVSLAGEVEPASGPLIIRTAFQHRLISDRVARPELRLEQGPSSQRSISGRCLFVIGVTA